VNKELADSILASIAIAGNASTDIKNIIATKDKGLSRVLSLSSGAARIQTNVVKRFNLIMSQPSSISILNPFEIRCCLCRSVIQYPAWYYSIRYAVNHFHYFVCFDSSSLSKPSCKCYGLRPRG
jgi:hypothetical protein